MARRLALTLGDAFRRHPPHPRPASVHAADTDNERIQKMKTTPESVNVLIAIRTVRDDIRKTNPRLRTIHDWWIRGALVVHSAGTR
jgi:hypothetical protein